MKEHTVEGRLKTVKLWDHDFLVSRHRGIRIWLPKEYRKNTRTPYDVIYALDAQNLFDRYTGFLGKEWEIDETIEAEKKEYGIRPSIVVGIDNSPDRLSEYFPRFSNIAVGMLGYRAPVTFDFLINQVIPYVENNYRVKNTREGRSFLGSSMGGLMALEAGIHYNRYFSTVYAFSPSFTMYKYGMNEVPPVREAVGNNSALRNVIKKLLTPSLRNSFKLILESGGKGNYEHECLHNMRYMHNKLIKGGWKEENLGLFLYPEEEHNEDQWNNAFYDAYRYVKTGK